ncbi:hypothetical protein K2Z84_34710 [Candidatus Binatia bacterium]|jgi:hypothetical protein|nr:hypothetical protein [Candidatus Binatia bacterium]
MQIFVNDRALGEIDAARVTVGEVVEALGVHVDPGEILSTVALDEEVIAAGDDERYARRPAAGVRRLTLSTCSTGAFAARLRADAREALASIEGRLRRVIDALGAGEMRAAHGELAIALEELRLMLLVDQHAMQLDGGQRFSAAEEVEPVAEALLGAQRRADGVATRTVLAERLLPLLRDWNVRACALDAVGSAMS